VAIPLATIIWLAIIWNLIFPGISKTEIVPLPPIDARFVELPKQNQNKNPRLPKKESSDSTEPKPEPKLN